MGDEYDAGSAYVYLGGSKGISATNPIVLSGPVVGEGFGGNVSGADDINGDGYADLVVGAPEANSNTGAAYVFLGGPTGPSASPSQTLVSPAGANGFYGSSTSGAGDLNGDGFADVLVSAPQVNSQTGAVYVYLGGSGGLSTSPITLTGMGTQGFFGFALAGMGDATGNGFGDLTVGAGNLNNGQGAAYVYYGNSSGVSTNPFETFASPAGPNGGFGAAVQ